MHRRQKLKAERRFKAIDEFGNSVKASTRFRMIAEKYFRVLGCSGNQCELFVRGVAAVRIAGHEVSLHCLQNMAQILGIRPELRLLVAQLERLSGLLHEIHKFMNLKQGDERIEQPLR